MPDSKPMPFAFAMNINTRDETTGEPLQPQKAKNFCIAMLGNFSASGDNPANEQIIDRGFIEIDRYNFDDVLASMGLQLSLATAPDSSTTLDITINSLKDFHPDSLYKKVAVFGQLRDLRERLNNPQTFKQAMLELGVAEQEQETPKTPQAAEDTPQPQSAPATQPAMSGTSLLDAIMDETEGRSGSSTELSSTKAVQQQSKTLVDALIKQIEPQSRRTVARDARQDELVASIDAAISQQMRDVLHHPQFRALEASWRAVHFLVKRIPANKSVKLYLLDVSRSELASDLDRDDVTQSQLYRQFCDASAGDIDWSLIIADYRFGPDIDDILLLSQLGIIAQQAGTQLIAAADEKLVGCDSFAKTPKADQWNVQISQPVSEAWALLRKSPVAKNISLALPRFMLRDPYGSKSTALKSFAFEEMTTPPEHEDYCWGNPAFLKAEQIARAFIQTGWELQFARVMESEDLPVHYYEMAGRSHVKPCAEIALSDSGASRMIAQGLIPLWSVKNSDRVHSGDFHSIAE